jgi:hypothetical protein
MAEALPRKLVAILGADIAGYSALVSSDEAQASVISKRTRPLFCRCYVNSAAG